MAKPSLTDIGKANGPFPSDGLRSYHALHLDFGTLGATSFGLAAGIAPAVLANMITLEDCVALCGLTKEEVLAIAEHEHLPEIAATALAQYLLSEKGGSEKVRDMIVDDIRQAQIGGDKQHVLTLLHVLHHFLKTHPEAKPVDHPWSKRL
jgi:hypothetical protein